MVLQELLTRKQQNDSVLNFTNRAADQQSFDTPGASRADPSLVGYNQADLAASMTPPEHQLPAATHLLQRPLPVMKLLLLHKSRSPTH